MAALPFAPCPSALGGVQLPLDVPVRSTARIRRPLVGGAVTAIALPLLALPITPLTAHADEVEACPPEVRAGDAASAELEDVAVDLAVACGTEVDVLEHMTEYSSVTALPSGALRFETTGTAERTLVGNEWQDIDLNLEPAEGGYLRPAVSAADVRFSSGGDSPFATMVGDDGATFSLTWPDPLPNGVVDGSSVVYPEVMPDVDLVVAAEPGGFSHVVVVHSPEAAANPDVRRISLVTSGTAELSYGDEGRMILTGPGGVLAEGAPPVAWDSAGADSVGVAASSASQAGEAALVVPIDVAIADGELNLEPDERLFDEGEYPLYIDPKWEKTVGSGAYWGYANDGNRNCTVGSSNERAAVGSIPVDGALDCYGLTFRSLFTFTGADTFADNRILSEGTKFDIILNHTYHCSGTQPVWLYRTGASVSANGQRVAWSGASLSKYLDRADAPSAHCGNPTRALSFSGSNLLSDLRSHSGSTYSVALSARDTSGNGETVQERWKKFQHGSARLTVMYEHRPTAPVAVRTAPGGACAASGLGPWINDRNPTLYGRATDNDGQVKIQFNLNGPTSPSNYTSPWTKSKAERGWTTPTLKEGSYQWRVRGTDDADSTSWTSYCNFRIDHTAPTAPIVERISGAPSDGQPVTLRLSSSDALSGIKEFSYGVGIDVQEQTVASPGLSEITFVPTPGRTSVYVWAMDNAGNYSQRTVYNFFTGRIVDAQPQGAWRLDGDGFDDSGLGHDLAFDLVPNFGPDRLGADTSALSVDGNACGYTEASVLRTDAEYSIAGWAKVDPDAEGYQVLASQVGQNRSNFQLQFNSETKKWSMSLVTADGDQYTWATYTSQALEAVGRWQHIAATVDPVSAMARLYIDGELAVEGDVPFTPWDSYGSFSIGCAVLADGARTKMFHGSLDHVGVWQGLLSNEEIAWAATELPAGVVADWRLRGDGADNTGYRRDLTVPADTEWLADQYGRTESAMRFDRTQCAGIDDRIIKTNESFSIDFWALSEDAAQGVVIAQTGQSMSKFKVGISQEGRWYFHMASQDSDAGRWHAVLSNEQAAKNEWTHLTAVYDATKRELRLYVNGVHQGSREADFEPWGGPDMLRIGCQGYQGTAWSGAISGVRVWRGAVTGDTSSSLLGHWKFSAFERGNDATAFNNHIDLPAEGSFVAGPSNKDEIAWSKTASTTCAVTDGTVVKTNESFGVSAWVKPAALGDKEMVIVSQKGTNIDAFKLQYGVNTKRWEMSASRADQSGTSWWYNTSNSQPVAGQWVQLTAVYDQPRGELRLYVNGTLQTSRATGVNLWNADGSLCIGGTRTYSQQFNGSIADVRVWTGTAVTDTRGTLIGNWNLGSDKRGEDVTPYQRDVVLPADATFEAGPNRNAWQRDGTSATPCATTNGPVIDTSQSFSISVRVRLESGGGTNPMIVGQAGEWRPAFYLEYLRSEDRWNFTIPSADDPDAQFRRVLSKEAPVMGRWTELTAVYDAAQHKQRLYVDGVLQGEVNSHPRTWQANGPLVVGCATRTNGEEWHRMEGAVAELRVWKGAVDATVNNIYGGNPGVQWQGYWPLEGPESDTPVGLVDSSGNGRDLTATGGYEWVRDRANGRDGAMGLQLNEGSCAITPGPVVVTDESFTVAAWVSPDLTSGQTMVALSQSGANRDAFRLQYSGTTQRWEFVVRNSDNAAGTEYTASSNSTAVTDEWVYLTGVFDLAKREIRLYVNGELESITAIDTVPFPSNGSLRVGAGFTTGNTVQHFSGAIDDVHVWSSTLHPDRIADMAAA